MVVPPIKALIFMKGYSERVPRKNMRNFCGRPLFHWILDVLSSSNFIGEIIINTDSDEIAESARKNYNVTIHMRPDYLCKIIVNEANEIIEYDISQSNGDLFLLTHSTNPLLTVDTIDNAIESFINQKTHDSLMSVTPHQKRFFWDNGRAINHNPNELIKTQELSIIMEENSCLYIFSRSMFENKKNRIGDKPLLFPINKLESIDIDDLDDFTLAEAVMKNRVNAD